MASNTFKAPYQPFRNIYLLTSWQANDPLVHYMVDDLTDLSQVSVALDDLSPSKPDPIANLSRVNDRYEPWGWFGSSSVNPPIGQYEIGVKDPVSTIERSYGRSDDWDFPTNQTLDASWLGRVHRGTPWQTIYLKAPAVSLDTWVQWTGNDQLVSNRNVMTGVTWDAAFSHPTNDWRLASLLAALFNTNSASGLHSVNQPNAPAWRAVLDGMVALTNTPAGQLDSVTIQSNSAPALTIAGALDAMRSSQPGGSFHGVGDILATPELSTASPWLDLGGNYPDMSPVTDAAFEAIPAQLLGRLRPDSVGSVRQTGGSLQVEFTGLEGFAYGLQASSNLVDWISVSTNCPTNGVFTFPPSVPADSSRWFYRSVLGP